MFLNKGIFHEHTHHPALLAPAFSGVAEAAPSIYPVDTARFLGGSRFDFKVELTANSPKRTPKS